MSTIAIGFVVTVSLTIIGVVVAQLLLQKRSSQHQAKVNASLTACQTIFASTYPLANESISKDVRRGLVMLLKHHIGVIEKYEPAHPMLNHLTARMVELNRIPAGRKQSRPRKNQDRQNTRISFERIAEIMQAAVKAGFIDAKNGKLAQVSAQFAAGQVAIDGARQAIRDAEHVRNYPQAMRYALHAKALCRKLPPLLAEQLNTVVQQDIERVEHMLQPQSKAAS